MEAHETKQTAQADYGEVIDLIIIVVYFSQYTIQLCIMTFLLTLQMWRDFLSLLLTFQMWPNFLVASLDASNVVRFFLSLLLTFQIGRSSQGPWRKGPYIN